ncbi:unnamed protein product (macronuclear) [Paramecium tetraurelia]|uniref:Uncharacterized protein n=1 Tax=Paramecium tetraurelia TaxID=5888 RepID=A0EH24_PARTE|nr:uncharacterized protein GSPATT00026939001 [Paramecium tetraurelia]CAK94615.1 unnamed protein product [Paramecium tetraurelia]|eukprot:XP_001461988.1 hypothetical protein (macronuclear) [Paramecium tetraurelia strain d4-2]
MLHQQTKPFLSQTFSRKISTPNKRSQALSTLCAQDLPSYSPSKHILSDQKPLRFQTLEHQKTQQPSSHNANSVSCQTNMSLCCFDDPLPDIPPSDPIWLQIIPQETLKGSSVEQLFRENKQYFYHLLSQYFKEQIQGDFNMTKFQSPIKCKTRNDYDSQQKSNDKIQPNKNSFYENYKSPQHQQFAKTSYKSDFTGYAPQNYNVQTEKLKYEKAKQQIATLISYKINDNNYEQNQKMNRLTAPRLSTSTEIRIQAYKNYNQALEQPQLIEQTQNCKNNYSKLNPLSSKGIFFEKKSESYFQYPLHPLPKSSKTFLKQYSTIIKKDIQGPKIGDVTQMKNWRQSVIKQMNHLRRLSQN